MRAVFKKDINNNMSQPRTRLVGRDLRATEAFASHLKSSVRKGVDNGGKAGNRSPEGEGVKAKASKTKRMTIICLLIVLLIAVFLLLSVSTSAKVVIIQPTGFTYQPHSLGQYELATSQDIGSSLYNLNKLTLNSSSIASMLEQKFPEIQYAAVTIGLIGSTPTVYLQLTMPEILFQTPSGSYILNHNGVVITGASSFSSHELNSLPVVDSGLNSRLKLGDQVLGGNNVIFIQTVKAALSGKGQIVSKFVLVPGAEEMDVYISGINYYVKFNLSENDALQQVGTYLAAIANLKQQGKVPTSYVDVRVDGRAYYK